MLNEYGSFAFPMDPWGTEWTNIVGTSRTAARDEAVASCGSGCQEVLWFRNACGSLAWSSSGHIAGVGWGETESDAQESAIDRCHAQEGKECSVVAADTVCAKAGSATPSGQPSPIPPRPCPAGQERKGGDGECIRKPALGGGALDDVNVTLSASCPQEIEMCVRDYQCEDGDQIRVSVNGNQVFEGELLKYEWSDEKQCFPVPVNVGANTVTLRALNGTGGRGNCSHANLNTGEIRIHGQEQAWQHVGGAGSSANINVTIGLASDNCDVPVIESPRTTISYGAFYHGSSGTASVVSGGSGSSAQAAEIEAKARCEHAIGASCQVALRGYTNACGAFSSSDTAPPTIRAAFHGFGMSESRQEAKNLARQDCERKAEGTAVSGTCRDRSRSTRGASASILRITAHISSNTGHISSNHDIATAFCVGTTRP